MVNGFHSMNTRYRKSFEQGACIMLLFLAALLASTQAQAQYFFDSQIISGSDVSLNTASFSLRGPVKSVHRQDIVYPEHCAMANPYIVFNAEGPQMQYRDIKFNSKGMLSEREGVEYKYDKQGRLLEGYGEKRTWKNGHLLRREADIFDTDEESLCRTITSVVDSIPTNLYQGFTTYKIRYARDTYWVNELQDIPQKENRNRTDTCTFHIMKLGSSFLVMAYGKTLSNLEFNDTYTPNGYLYESWVDAPGTMLIMHTFNVDGELVYKSYSYNKEKYGSDGKGHFIGEILYEVNMRYDNYGRIFYKKTTGGWGTKDGRSWAGQTYLTNRHLYPEFEFTYTYNSYGDIEDVAVIYKPDIRVEAGYVLGNKAYKENKNFWDTVTLKRTEKRILKYEYTYDSYGNWTEQKLYSDGYLIRTSRREIIYW